MSYNIAIMGATGAVGREIMEVLYNRKFQVKDLKLFASHRSAGKTIDTPFGRITIENSDNADYANIEIAFFAISGSWSKANAQKATDQGCCVIDNSSAFRYDDKVPLVIPEINSDAIKDSLLIANPNCTTAIAAIPLFEIHKEYGLKKVFISTYQATSGAGAAGMKELEDETRNYLEGKEAGHNVFTYPIAFNTIPHIDNFQDNDYTREEMKVVWETRKIFNCPDIPISCTCVRIPTMRVHGESIVIETEKEIDPVDAKILLQNTPGVDLKDDIENNVYPMPLTATKKYNVEVGRIRQNLILGAHGLEFFVCGDQILKGAALNAVQIAETLANR